MNLLCSETVFLFTPTKDLLLFKLIKTLTHHVHTIVHWTLRFSKYISTNKKNSQHNSQLDSGVLVVARSEQLIKKQ